MTVRPAAVWGDDGLQQQIQSGDQAIVGDLVILAPPIAAGTVTLSAWRTVINGAAPIASLTVALPAAPVDRQTHYVTTRTAIAALTLTVSSLLGLSPTSLSAGSTMGFVYSGSAGTWIRIQ